MLAWFRSLPHQRRWLTTAVVVLVLVHLTYIVHRRHSGQLGDFDVNREFGACFLAGGPLYEGGSFNYMPVSALYWAPLALMPREVAFVVRYAVALVGLALTLRWLGLMLPPGWRRSGGVGLTALTFLFSLKYLLRDLDDGGPHLIYLAMLVGGGYCAWRGWKLLGGVWFGLAIALKMTPVLLLPYLAWKRQWRLLGATTAATAGWIMLPALWLGLAPWWQDQQLWNQVALSVFTGKAPAHVDPDANDLRVQNQSLKLALMHVLTVYPQGHPLHLEKGYWTALNLGQPLAGVLTRAAMAALFAAFLWRIRRGLTAVSAASGPLELAALLVLMLLFSPVTWVQHLVWTVPVLFFILAAYASAQRSLVGRCGLGTVLVLTLVLNREILGKELYLVLLNCHIHTIGLLILLALVLRLKTEGTKDATAAAFSGLARAA